MKTILILGAGIMQMPAIRIAKSKGWRVILADGNPDALARDMGDSFEHVDLKDRDALAEMAARHKGGRGLDGVFTAGTDFSISVAWVAEKLALPGIPFEVARRATDKCLMREAFSRAGVASPDFVCWTGTGDPAALLGPRLSFPLVVKPVDNMGARGVRRVETRGDLASACAEALRLSRSARVIVERYMEGPELSLDAIVWRGEITVCGIADRHIFFPPNFVELGHTMPTSLDQGTVSGIVEVFKAGIKAIGIDNGAAKGDMKLTTSGPMVGEIAARLSGGYMSGWTFPLASGVEVTEAAMNIAVGLPPGDLAPRFHRVCAERALISIPGTVGEVVGEEEALATPGVQHVFLRVQPGDTVVFPSNNVQKSGNVIAVAETRVQAVAAANAALAALCVRLKPQVATTSRYLYHESGNDIFPDVPHALRKVVDAMPASRGDPSFIDPVGTITVVALKAPDAEEVLDLNAAPLLRVADRALRIASGVFAKEGEHGGFQVGNIFWKALMRGGLQGGIYLLDSLREAALHGEVREFLSAL